MRNIALILFSLTFGRGALAQQARVTMLDFSAGSEMEDYLRVMQIAGKVPLYPWSIRGFSRPEIERFVNADSTGPWKLRDRFNDSPLAAGPLRLGATFNSAFAYGANDGPVWAGRGLTTVASGGVSGHVGHLSIAIDPLAFRAGNTAFDIVANGKTGRQAFGHATFPDNIDLPQRFGDKPYSRVDPGNSSIRFDSRAVTFGISTANEWMGPATEFPFLLSNNAAGFPHIFIGTGEPVGIWIGKLHVRFGWGKLYQSAYSPVTGPTQFAFDTAAGVLVHGGTIRLAATGEFAFVPRGVPGLELGVGRFFHVPNTVDQPNSAFWRKPLRIPGLKNENDAGDIAGFDNQLGSIFFRWAFPRAGLEVFGERGFEDQLYDFRDLTLNLDHEREYMLGLQKTLRIRSNEVDVLRAELVNYQEPGLARDRYESGIYLHSTLIQGHTNRGQLLGASPGAGWAAASSLAWTRYSSASRTTITLRRIVRAQRGEFETTGLFDPKSSDVIVGAGLDRTRFGRVVDLGVSVEAMQDFNRNFSRDVPNLNLRVTARAHPW
ncbi:MAG TPA: hypothetical protein VJ840_04100 [Gemmatimonadaceae bacterium]|nr:hypothetical protein [Gemmatimonadaceae bacterium]